MIHFLKFNFIGIVLLSSVCACSSGSETTDDTDNDTTVIHVDSLQKYPKSGEIKILSFNVRQATNEQAASNNWDFRKAACVDMVEDQKPTVIGFQEAVYSSQWTYLKEQLSNDYEGYGVGRDDGSTQGETMGILWKKSDVEKLKTGTFWLSDSPDTPSKGWGGEYNRCATWGLFKMKATGQIFLYINTHLELSESVRSKEMELIIKKFAELNTDHYPQFFSADCNATSGDTIFNHFKKTMASARENASQTDYNNTYNGWGDGTGLLDNIFYSKNLTAVEYHTITESYGSATYLSDHYPIYAIIKF